MAFKNEGTGTLSKNIECEVWSGLSVSFVDARSISLALDTAICVGVFGAQAPPCPRYLTEGYALLSNTWTVTSSLPTWRGGRRSRRN